MAKELRTWTTEEAADYLRIPRRNKARCKAAKFPTTDKTRKLKALMPLIKAGEIDAFPVKGEWRIVAASVRAYEARQLKAVQGRITGQKGGAKR